MKRMKVLSLALALIMLVGILSSCGGNGDSATATPTPTPASSAPTDAGGEGSEETDAPDEGGIRLPITDEKTTFSVWAIMTTHYSGHLQSYNEIAGYAELEKRTNIHLDWQHPSSASTNEAFNLLLASQEYPDFIDGFITYYTSGLEKAVEDDIIIPLNDVIDQHIPSYAMRLEQYGLRLDATTDTGLMANLYGFFTTPQDAPFGFMMRYDWLDDLGLDVPETYDDWYEMLKLFRDEKGVSAPLMLSNVNACDTVWGNFKAGYQTSYTFYNQDGTVKFGPLDPQFKEWLELFAKWYDEGLIDRDFVSRETQMGIVFDLTLPFSGETGIWFGAPRATYTGDMAVTAGLVEDENFYCMAVQNPVRNRGEVSHLRAPSEQLDGGVVISTQCRDVETLAAWFNYCYSDEGSMYLNYGTEGETFKYDDNGEAMLVAEWVCDKYGDDNYSVTRFLTGPLSTAYVREAVRNSDVPIRPAVQQEACDILMRDLNDWAMPTFISYTADEKNELSTIMSDINTYVNEWATKIVLGSEPVESWDSTVIPRIQSMSIDRATSIQQAALDRYLTRGQ